MIQSQYHPESSTKLNSHFFFFNQKVTIFTFNIDNKC